MSVVVALCVCIVLCTEMRTSSMEPLYVHSIVSNGEDRGIFVPSDILCQVGWWKILCGNWISYVRCIVLVTNI